MNFANLKFIKYAEEKGREEGRVEERELMAKNLLAIGMEDDLITKATGVDKKILDMLKKSLNPSQ